MSTIRGEVLIVQKFGQAVSVVATTITAFLLLCELVSMWERWSTLKVVENRTTLYSTLSLLAVTIFGLWVAINGTMLWWLDWRASTDACSEYMIVITLVYVVMKQFTYLFLCKSHSYSS
jgi:hypothetical protein